MKLKCIINLNHADERKGQSPQPGRAVWGCLLSSASALFGRAGPRLALRTRTPETRHLPWEPSPKPQCLGWLPCTLPGPPTGWSHSQGKRGCGGLQRGGCSGSVQPSLRLSAGMGVRPTHAEALGASGPMVGGCTRRHAHGRCKGLRDRTAAVAGVSRRAPKRSTPFAVTNGRHWVPLSATK